MIVNKKYYFSKDDLTICKNIHKVKGTQENLKIEQKWFEWVATNVRTPCSFLVISDSILKKLKDLIPLGRKIFTVDNQLEPKISVFGFVPSCWTTLVNIWSNGDICENFQLKWM